VVEDFPLTSVVSVALEDATHDIDEFDADAVPALLAAAIVTVTNASRVPPPVTQAVAVVQNFFSTNTVKSFQLLHRAGSGDGCYGIGNLQTSTQTLRTYFYVKTSGSTSVIQELRFEKE